MGAARGLQGQVGVINQSRAQVVNGSLRFDSTQTQYLSRTPGSAGNRKTWTWSGWYKRGNLTSDRYFLFGCGPDGNDFFAVEFGTSGDADKILIQDYPQQKFVITSQVFRDPSAWYHIVIAVDTTQAINTDRIKLYVNGVRVTAFTQYDTWTRDMDTRFNRASPTAVGDLCPGFNKTFSGYTSNVYFLDGQALGPEFFGFTDPLTNTWRPRKLKTTGPNNGTVWSNTYTASNSFQNDYPKTNGFDGNIATRSACSTSGCTVTFSPSPGIVVNRSLRVYTGYGSASVNGGSAVDFTGVDRAWVNLNFTGTLTSLAVTGQSGFNAGEIYAVEVDGIILVDSSTTNAGFGTNGFYLPFDTDGAGDIGIGTDRSGRGNNWTTNNFVTTAAGIQTNPNIMPDSPSGISFSTAPTSGIGTTTGMTKPSNYATWNPVGILKEGGSTTSTLSNGNLDIAFLSGTNALNQHFSTIPMSSGKWYCEWTATNSPASNNTAFIFGVQSLVNKFISEVGNYSYGFSTGTVNQLWTNGSNTNNWWTGTPAAGDVFAIALDLDRNQISFYRNGTILGSGAVSIVTGTYFFAIQPYQWQGTPTGSINFGQKSFKYAPPAGFLPLCTANLPRPTTDAVVRPDKYVGIVTYTGNGTTQTVSGLNFKPDLVWIKSRNDVYYNYWQDSVRGSTQTIFSNTTGIERTNPTGLTTITSSGFTVGSGQEYMAGNLNNVTYVAWCWKAGGGGGGLPYWINDVGYATTTAAGLTAGSRPLTGASVNTKAGFSIVTFTSLSPANNPHTMAHGLSQAPEFIVVKARTSNTGANDWFVYHKDVGNDKYMVLNSTAAPSTYQVWNNTTPTSSVFSMGSGTDNGGIDWVGYLWHSVSGFSKFSSYTGTGVAGNFVHTGFRPKWIMIKNYNGGSISNWALVDSTRSYANVANHTLAANLDNAESYFSSGASVFGVGNKIDLVSNGFVLREGNSWGNETSTSYIYAAFAETPSFNLYGGQSNAR